MIKNVIDLSSALLTPAIASLAVVVAYWQYALSNTDLKFKLYDRRLKVFEAVTDLLAEIVREANISLVSLGEFRRKTAEGYFLFDKDVSDFLVLQL
jgi:hypothetical protein